ncbi:hypothetical protein U1Q18_000117 [Sarracenia purpurea var. burkii]
MTRVQVWNSTPIVALESKLNSFRVNQARIYDLLTAESPMSTTLKTQSIFWLTSSYPPPLTSFTTSNSLCVFSSSLFKQSGEKQRTNLGVRRVMVKLH